MQVMLPIRSCCGRLICSDVALSERSPFALRGNCRIYFCEFKHGVFPETCPLSTRAASAVLACPSVNKSGWG